MKFGFAVCLAAAGLACCTAASFDSAAHSHSHIHDHHAMIQGAAATMQHHKGFLRHDASADGSVHDSAMEEPAGMSTLQIVLLVVVGLGLLCCVGCFCVVKSVASKALEEIKNQTAKDMRKQFDEKCPEEKKAKYCSPEFHKECAAVFAEVDTDKNGTLSLEELRGVTTKYLGDDMNKSPQFASICDGSLMRAFDKNGDSKIDSDEFFELMKWVKFNFDEKNNTEAGKKSVL